jgi:TldD protein
MVDPALLSDVLKKVLIHGGEYADIFVEQKRLTSLHLEDGRIEKVFSGIDCGVGIRLISRGRTAYGFSNDFSRIALVDLAAALSKTFSLGTATNIHLDLKRERPKIDFAIAMLPDNVPTEKKIQLVKSADRTARSFDNRIKQVTVTYRDSAQSVQIATSDNVIAEDERIHTVSAVHVITTDGRLVQTGYEAEGGSVGFELFDSVSLDALSLRAARRAILMLTSRKAPGGRMPIVISSEAGGTMIHEAIGHGLEADLAQQGLSVYSHKMGSEVASKLVTVLDDSTLPGKRGSFRFDDEGIPSGRTTLVDRGVLVGYLFDRLTAMRDGVRPTGNGRRESYHHRPIPRMTNTFIAPGDSSPDEVTGSTQRGLFVRKMGGGQVNTVTGDFVFAVQEGYLIENGQIGDAVRGATLTGNGPDVLRSIDMVASDLGFSIGTCGKDSQGVPVSDAMPTLRVAEMVVGGAVDL